MAGHGFRSQFFRQKGFSRSATVSRLCQRRARDGPKARSSGRMADPECGGMERDTGVEERREATEGG